MKTVLLITEQFDPTADILIGELRRQGQPVVRWNLDQFPLNSTLSYSLSDEAFSGALVTDGKRVNFCDIGSVWCRSFVPSGLVRHLAPEELEFTKKEAQLSLNALLQVTRWFWINNPKYERLASSKPGQLLVARNLGFHIPDTIVTNDPEEVRRFHQSHQGEVIYKAASQWMDVEAGTALFTNKVTETELQHIDLIKHAPGIFQQLVPKAFELRVTVIGAEIFAVKIHSQDDDKTQMDWRKSPLEIKFEPFCLPEEIASKVLTFMEQYHLAYGALDFIVTPEGRYVFLENNPGGQYLWVETATELPITAALAAALKKGSCEQ